MQEEISILMLAYNHEKWIAKAIESILKQKTKYKFKIYIHEDCSTDNTREIVKKYKNNYPDIIELILADTNRYSRGINIIMDIMLPQTKGKYIMICEGDDYWTYEGKIELQIDYMEKNNDCEFTFGNADIIYVNGKFFKKFLPDNIWNDVELQKKILNKNGCDFTINEIILLDFIPTASICITRHALKMLEGFSDVFDLIIRLIGTYAGKKAHYFNKTLSAYRTGNINSASGSISNSYELQYKYFYTRHKKAYEKFDKFSNYKYHDTLMKATERKLVITELTRSYCKAKKINVFYELSFSKRTKEFIRFYFPMLFNLLKIIRHKC